MAEALIVGPLFNLTLFLGKHIWKRYNWRKDKEEYDNESVELLNVVESLAQFAQEKAIEIQQINIQLGISPYSLGLNSVKKNSDIIENLKWDIWIVREDVEKILNNKKLKAFVKIQRIQGIHNRLTQSFFFHLGIGSVEGAPMKVQLSRQFLDKCNETENTENIANMCTFQELNMKFSNQGHHPHQYSSASLHNLNEYPPPPYQRKQEYIPGHQHHGDGQSFTPDFFELTNVSLTTKKITVCLRDPSRQSRK